MDYPTVDHQIGDHQTVTAEYIKLDQFLKLAGLVETGGQAKVLIKSGEVTVNEMIEQRRGRKLIAGDRVMLNGQSYTVSFED